MKTNSYCYSCGEKLTIHIDKNGDLEISPCGCTIELSPNDMLRDKRDSYIKRKIPFTYELKNVPDKDW